MKDFIIFSIACAVVTAIIVSVVVVPYPREFTSYLALSFALVLDGLLLYFIILWFKKSKDKPKTVSGRFVWWLLAVFYCCLMAAGFLTDAYIQSPSAIALTFDCIFAAIGLAALVGLAYQFIAYISIRRCLKHGKDATAQFAGVGKSLTFEGGKPQTSSYRMTVRYSVTFTYLAEGRERTAKSRRVFSQKEVEALQAMGTFNIKYNRRTAVINEILKTT